MTLSPVPGLIRLLYTYRGWTPVGAQWRLARRTIEVMLGYVSLFDRKMCLTAEEIEGRDSYLMGLDVDLCLDY